jgi:hypothetical protein
MRNSLRQPCKKWTNKKGIVWNGDQLSNVPDLGNPYINALFQLIMDTGTQCCNSCFDFSRAGLQNVKFYVAGGTVIIVTYTQGGVVYTRISFDCGATFSEPRQILALKGQLKTLEVLARDDQFVVATVEIASGKEVKRAVAGLIRANENDFDFRECDKPKDYNEDEVAEVINVSLGFREMEDNSGRIESVDYVFYRNPQGLTCLSCQGHG